MIVLSVDTTGRAGSAAIVDGTLVLAEVSGDPALTHGQRLPGELIELVNRAGIRVNAVDLLAVAAGPGSFTGLRVGIAVMQGLAMALGKPIVPVSTLEALARVAPAVAGRLIAPWVDAQRGEVFASLYESAETSPILAASALPPDETLTSITAIAGGRRVHFIGDGATRYADLVASTLGGQAEVAGAAPRLAGAIGLIAAAAPHRAVAPHAVAPIYVRRPDVELTRERRAREA